MEELRDNKSGVRSKFKWESPKSKSFIKMRIKNCSASTIWYSIWNISNSAHKMLQIYCNSRNDQASRLAGRNSLQLLHSWQPYLEPHPHRGRKAAKLPKEPLCATWSLPQNDEQFFWEPMSREQLSLSLMLQWQGMLLGRESKLSWTFSFSSIIIMVCALQWVCGPLADTFFLYTGSNLWPGMWVEGRR